MLEALTHALWQPLPGARVRQVRVPDPRRLLGLGRGLVRDELHPLDDALREWHGPTVVGRRW